MGEDHKEDILKHLKEWLSLSLEQKEAFSRGNLDEFEKLTKVSVLLQSRIDEMISQLGPAKIDKPCITLLNEIQSIQSDLVLMLKGSVSELSETIGALRKNRTSLMGYRQTQAPPPRYKSERT